MGAARFAAFLSALLLASCATPPIDRYLLQAERAPVRLEGSRGPLSRAQTEQVLAELRRKSPDTAIFDTHVKVEEALNGNPLSIGNRVTLLEDGPATYAAMLAAIRAAKHHIHLESYIFEGDEVGQQFARALIERRKAGVQVRVVFDSVGSLKTPREFFQQLANADIEVVEFNPVNAGTVLSRGLLLNRRNHRKLTIVDGRVAFLGGVNISGVYTAGGGVERQKGGIAGSRTDTPNSEPPWRDTQVRIEGPVVTDLQKSFARIWTEVLKQPPLDDKRYFPALKPEGPHVVRALEGRTDAGLNPLYVTLISAIESAQTDVRVTMAYVVPHDELLSALKAAAARGVDVQLLLPGHTDSWMVLHAGRSYYEELLAAGVKIYERKARLLHSKTATVDGVWSTVGSTNLDWRSLLHNDEINVVVLGPDFAVQLNRIFQHDLANSTAITTQLWNSRPVADRLREQTARTWAQLL